MANAELTPACDGEFCGVDGNTFLGTGWGIWSYDNLSDQPAEVSIDIAGLKQDTVAVIFTNASDKQKTLAGDLKSRKNSYYVNELPDPELSSHANRAELLIKPKSTRGMLTQPPAIIRQPVTQETTYYADEIVSYEIGAKRTWKSIGVDAQKAEKIYEVAATLSAKIATLDSRVLHIWVEDKTPALITQEEAKNLAETFLKVYGTVTQLTQGQPWGPHNATNLISATNRDIHFLFEDMPAQGMKEVAGFFDPASLYTDHPRSNHALVLFINGKFKADLAKEPEYSRENTISTLAHELTHMINFYERAVTMGSSYQFDLWLEEATALAVEDVVSPILFPGATPSAPPKFHAFRDTRISSWLDLYFECDLTMQKENVICKPSTIYPVSSSFIAFLLRYYGIRFFRALLKSHGNGVDAIQMALRNSQGSKVDRWEVIMRRWGSVLALLPGRHIPLGYGLPECLSEGFRLIELDVATVEQEILFRKKGGGARISLSLASSSIPANTMLPYSQGMILDYHQDETYKRTVTVPAGVSVAVYVNRPATS